MGSYHRDGYSRSVWENKSHVFKLSSPPPVLCKPYPTMHQRASSPMRDSQNDAYHPAPLSPSPWAKMIVAVCFLIAGTVNALEVAAIVMRDAVRSLKSLVLAVGLGGGTILVPCGGARLYLCP